MKKVIAVAFLVLIGVLFLKTAQITSYKKMYAAYLKNGGGVRGAVMTMISRSTLSDAVQNDIFLHDEWIDLYGLFLRTTSVDTMQENGLTVSRLEGGSLAFVREVQPEFNDEQRASIQALRDAAEASGAECWFVSIPQKVCAEQSRFIARGVTDGTPQTEQMRLRVFTQEGYHVLDLHERMHAEGFSHPQMYFRTDHHWTAQSGLWAAGEVARALGIDDSALQQENFTVEPHPGVFLGSEARYFGRYYCGFDDLDILIPNFETDLTYQWNEAKPHTGSFSDALLFRNSMQGNPFVSFPYAVFLNGDFEHQCIRNNLLPQGKRLMFIKDSFSNSLASYLSLVCGQIDTYDPRYTVKSGRSLVQQARDGGYDAVIVDVSTKLSNGSFRFQ